MQLSPKQPERSAERNILSTMAQKGLGADEPVGRGAQLDEPERKRVAASVDALGLSRAIPAAATAHAISESGGSESDNSASDFQNLAKQLTDSYAELASQVTELSDQLDAAKAAREQELIEKERLAHRLTALLDSLPGGVLVLDRHHTVILANPIAVDMLGEPLLNMNFLSVIGEVAKSIAADGKQIVMNSGCRVTISNQPKTNTAIKSCY